MLFYHRRLRRRRRGGEAERTRPTADQVHAARLRRLLHGQVRQHRHDEGKEEEEERQAEADAAAKEAARQRSGQEEVSQQSCGCFLLISHYVSDTMHLGHDTIRNFITSSRLPTAPKKSTSSSLLELLWPSKKTPNPPLRRPPPRLSLPTRETVLDF